MLMQLSFDQANGKLEVTRQFVTTFPDYPRIIFFLDKPLLAMGKRNKEEVWFYRANPEKYEPQWNIYSGGEVWYCIGGKNNFFYAAALFCYHVKVNLSYHFGSHSYKELIDKLLI